MPAAPAITEAGATSGVHVRSPVAVRWRAAGCIIVCAGSAACAAAGWHSPVRVVLAVAMLLVVPGEALALALDVREPEVELMIAVGASLSLGSVVSLVLLYVHAWSLALATGILIAFTVASVLVADVRVRRLSSRRQAAGPIGP